MELLRMGKPDFGSIHALDVDGLFSAQEKELLDYPPAGDVYDSGLHFFPAHLRPVVGYVSAAVAFVLSGLLFAVWKTRCVK